MLLLSGQFQSLLSEHHQRNLFHLKLGPAAAGFIFSSGIQEAEWKVSWISSPEEHPSGWEMRRGGFLLTFTLTAHFVLHLLLAPSSLIQLIKKKKEWFAAGSVRSTCPRQGLKRREGGRNSRAGEPWDQLRSSSSPSAQLPRLLANPSSPQSFSPNLGKN